MSSNEPGESIPLQEAGNLDSLLNAFLLARFLESMRDDGHNANTASNEEPGASIVGPSHSEGAPSPPMPVPLVFPQPTLTVGAPSMPEPKVTHGPAPGVLRLSAQPPVAPSTPTQTFTTAAAHPNHASPPAPPPPPPPPAPPPPATNATPVRPPSPDDTDVARGSLTWRLFTTPLFNRLASVLYDGKESVPEPTTGNVSYLKLDGYGARNSIENMCALIGYLQQRRWEDQSVDQFIEERKSTAHWPAKLTDKPHADHAKYAWLLMDGLLSVIGISLFFGPVPPPTFAGAVGAIFPAVPEGAAKPEHFSFSARELIAEDFIIQPTYMMLDHLKLEGNAVSVYVLATEQIQLLLSYDRNRVARAVGMADYGHEIMQSYGALVKEEFREKYRLPISLGMFKIDDERVRRGQYDDLTVVSGVIEKKHKDPSPYHPPQLLAGRVHIIENELRRRRHWYNQLRRDIHKRKREEPWMFWGTVLAVFFGVCTVIQTVTAVWSLVVSLS